jgi:hydroxyethylthiazole kinase-like uncharacterized protein yjeF
MKDIRRVTPQLLRAFPLPQPAGDTDKNSRGTVLVAGGSAVSAGAVVLSGTAAFRAGAGKVQLVVPQPLAVALAVGFPEAGVHGFASEAEDAADSGAASTQIRALLPGVDAALIGPGFTNKAQAQRVAADLLDGAPGPAFIIDALSLTGLWDHRGVQRHCGRLVITPHAGEMVQLTGASMEQVLADPARPAQQAATHLQCVVVLKGATTVIAQPQGPAYVHEANIAALATSGSGDVLAGLLAGLTARGASIVEAALWSVHLHALAAQRLSQRLGPLGLLARELPAEIPALMRDLAAAGTPGPQT